MTLRLAPGCAGSRRATGSGRTALRDLLYILALVKMRRKQSMKSILSSLGSLAGWAGVLVCLVAGLLRVAGFYQVAGYGTITFFIGGIGLLAAGCWFRLEASR